MVGRWASSGPGWECRPDGHWIETPRLVLRPLTSSDTAELLGVFDPEVVFWQGYPAGEDALKAFALSWIAGLGRVDPRGINYQWAICDRSTGEMVGTRSVLAYSSRRFRGRVCETGSSLKAGWREKGYGSEELRAVLNLVRTHLGYMTVVAGMSPANERAIRLYERCGFVRSGVRPGFILPNGTSLDALLLRYERSVLRSCRYALRPSLLPG